MGERTVCNVTRVRRLYCKPEIWGLFATAQKEINTLEEKNFVLLADIE